MTGAVVRRRVRGVVGGLLAAAVALATAVPAMATDRSAAEVLPGRTIATATVDLDADGAREVVRLVAAGGTGLEIEAWGFDGEWSRTGSAVVVAREAPGTAPTVPETATAALLPWRLDGRDRLLTLTGGWRSDGYPNPCCLSVYDVRSGGTGLELVRLDASANGDTVLAVDLDADGTDELVASSVTYADEGDDGTSRLSVLRWNGSGFDTAFETEREGQGYGLVTGNGDGRPGEEVYVNPIVRGSLERLSASADGFGIESAHVNLGERIDGWASFVLDGAVLVSVPDGFHLFEWPAGERMRPIGRVASSIYPSVGVLGEGDEALIVLHDGLAFGNETAPAATVFNTDLDEIGSVDTTWANPVLWEAIRDTNRGTTSLSMPLWPALGPFPGRIDGRPGYLVGDVLIQPDGAGGYTERRVGPIMSLSVIGRAGPGDEWVAIGDTFGPPDAGAYLAAYGGPAFYPQGSGVLTVVPVAELLAPPGEIDEVDVELSGAVESTAGDGEPSRLLADGDGFSAIIAAPNGTRVIRGGRLPADERVVADGRVEVEVEPRPSRNQRDEDFSEWLLAITPTGRTTITTWEGTFLREPPELVANARTELLSGTARVSGRGSEMATILVDGQPAQLNRFGAFHVEVDAPIWPRTVTVTARDPFGRETTKRFEVVGFVDYRGLPWVPMVAIATVAAGAILFVRTPTVRRRTDPQAGWSDAGLEEIDAD